MNTDKTQPQQADGRGAVIEALNMAKTYASSISDDWPEEMFAPTASDLGEALLVLAALQQSPATDNAPAVGAQERNTAAVTRPHGNPAAK